MIDQGKSGNTVNSRIKACKAFFHYLYREGWIKQNLAEVLYTVKSEKLMLQTFTKEQVAALLSQPDRKTFTGYRDYTMMMVMFETGMRIGELMNLKVGDILFKEQEIRITKGKGGRARRVPIQKTCCKVLRKYLDIRGDLETDALFVSITNSPLGSRTVQENMQEYGKKADITGVRVSPAYLPSYHGEMLHFKRRRRVYPAKNSWTRHTGYGGVLSGIIQLRYQEATSKI